MIVFKIGIVIFILLWIFHILTKKYLNPYKLIFIFGKKGSGKTTNLTKIALQHMRKGWKVYSTIEIPGTCLFDPEKIGFFTFQPNSVVLIDEVGMIWDNRDFKSFKPEVRDFFKYQRQYKLKVYMFSQTFDVDLKLRNLTDEMYLIKSFARVFSIQRRVLKKITVKQCADGTSTLADDYKLDLPLFGGLKWTFIPRYVVYFKSYDPKHLEYIKSRYIDMNDLQKEYLSTRKYCINTLKLIFISFVHWIRDIPKLIMGKDSDVPESD